MNNDYSNSCVDCQGVFLQGLQNILAGVVLVLQLVSG
jgi:hypothetical protein